MIEELYIELKPKLIKFFLKAYTLCESEEFVHDVFVKAIANDDDLNNKSCAKSWLFRIAINIYKDNLRKRSFRKSQTCKYPIIQSINFNTPEKQLVDKTKLVSIKSRFSELSDLEQGILTDSLLLGTKETCKKYSISENLYKVRLFRARQKLKKGIKCG